MGHIWLWVLFLKQAGPSLSLQLGQIRRYSLVQVSTILLASTSDYRLRPRSDPGSDNSRLPTRITFTHFGVEVVNVAEPARNRTNFSETV